MRSNNTPKQKVDKRKLVIRVIAWILVLMTVVTTLYTAIYFIVMGVNAADDTKGDLSIAVGILYGSNMDVALTAETTNGFTVGSEKLEKYDKTFSEIWSLPGYKRVTVLCDKNYAKVGDAYRVNDSPNVGAYRVDAGVEFKTKDELEAQIEIVSEALGEKDIDIVPAYINKTYRLRLGGYLTSEAAEAAIEELKALLPEMTLTVKSPSKTGTFAVDHSSMKALFEYDCGTDEVLAFDAIDDSDGKEAYLTMYNGNLYDGVLVFKRATVGTKEGIETITVVPLERYVMGVIPYEISNSWPLETQKAFAIVARTFAVEQLGKHWNQYGFNVCAASNCQVYRGVKSVNDRVREAVNSTEGQITTYKGKIAGVYYSSSTGNCTADVKSVWGGSIEWLTGVETPWEDYLNHTNAFWTAEVSPKELCEYLNSKGYTKLKGEIESITITSTAGANSTYVSGITIKDKSGNIETISRCDKVRSAFSKYVNSANFVVGKGEVSYTEYTKTVPPQTPVLPGGDDVVENSLFSIITRSGLSEFDFGEGVSVITGNGTISYMPDETVTVITANGKVTANITDGSTTDEGGSENNEAVIVTKTMKADDPDNFIFVGKGWGHGVGLSQWGLRDLANMNLDFVSMLEAYCPGIELGNYKDYVK